MNGKRYVGRRGEGRRALVHVLSDAPTNGRYTRPLSPRLDLRSHSPTGFEWGYAGSGPAQLALALVADATGDDSLAARVYQAFKFEVVAALPAEGWELSAAEVAERARALDAERAGA